MIYRAPTFYDGLIEIVRRCKRNRVIQMALLVAIAIEFYLLRQP
jgi:hypothetical protein